MAEPDEDRLEIAAFRRRVIAEAVEAGEGGVAAAIASAAASALALEPRPHGVVKLSGEEASAI